MNLFFETLIDFIHGYKGKKKYARSKEFTKITLINDTQYLFFIIQYY